MGVPVQQVLGCLFQFWAWADQHLASRNGHAPSVTFAHLNALVACDKFAEALADVGWLNSDDAGLYVPKYEVHMGKRGKTKALASNRKASQRGRKASRESHAHSVTPSSSSSLSISCIKEEGVQGEKPESTAGSGFVFVLKSGGRWELPATMGDHLVDAYPKLDVAAELKKAAVWLEANAGRRKTVRGMPAFLAGWMNRAAERTGGGHKHRPSMEELLKCLETNSSDG